MKNKKKNLLKWIKLGLVLAVFVLAVMIPSQIWNQKKIANSRVLHNSRLNPVIFIPGSSATQNRFDELVSVLNTTTKQAHSLLKITVQEDGKLSITGKIKAQDNEPFIVVGFANNKDGYSNIKKQAAWFEIAFTYLAKTYKFNHFKAIGHSNGGLIYTLFLEKYLDQDTMTIDKLMTIGTPYNGEETSSSTRTEILSDYVKNRSTLPTNLTVYSIAGSEDYTTDGTVPAESVMAGKYIFQNQVKSYTEITVTGSDAGHSDLPQNKEIVSLIQEYILKTSTNERNASQQNDSGEGTK